MGLQNGKAFGTINFGAGEFSVCSQHLKIDEDAFSTQGTGGNIFVR